MTTERFRQIGDQFIELSQDELDASHGVFKSVDGRMVLLADEELHARQEEEHAELAAALERAKAAVMSGALSVREVILNRLTGIALREGDSDPALRDSCFAAQRALLALTKSPPVAAPADAEQLQLALVMGYRAIADELHAGARSAFNGVDL